MNHDRLYVTRGPINCELSVSFRTRRDLRTGQSHLVRKTEPGRVASSILAEECPGQYQHPLADFEALRSELAYTAQNPLPPEITIQGNILVCTAFDECIRNLGEPISTVRVQQAMTALVE